MTYMHDEWCASSEYFEDGPCNCYVRLLEEKDGQIRLLRERLHRTLLDYSIDKYGDIWEALAKK